MGTMQPVMKRWFEKLERQKRATLADVGNWPEARLGFRPAEHAWSALEVLDHLWRVETACVAAMRGNLPGGHPVALRDRVAGLMVIGVMRSPVRVQVPATAKSVLPQPAAGRDAVASQWATVRRDLLELLNGLGPAQLGRGLLQHPVGGWMTPPRAMAFLSAHLEHHGHQLKRLRAASQSASLG